MLRGGGCYCVLRAAWYSLRYSRRRALILFIRDVGERPHAVERTDATISNWEVSLDKNLSRPHHRTIHRMLQENKSLGKRPMAHWPIGEGIRLPDMFRFFPVGHVSMNVPLIERRCSNTESWKKKKLTKF